MQNANPSLTPRPETIFGICERIGEDFGFNAQYLRVGLAAMLFWSPTAALGTYVVAGVLVLLSRWLYPDPAISAQPSHDNAGATAAQPVPGRGANDEQPAELAAAA
jgi:phage shock protein PspC (stress-responsive transcriptional regulator)